MLKTCKLCQKELNRSQWVAHIWYHHSKGELEKGLWHTELSLLYDIFRCELAWVVTAVLFPVNWVLAILDGVFYPLVLYREYHKKKRWEAKRKEKRP